jgi:hypothetical protein
MMVMGDNMAIQDTTSHPIYLAKMASGYGVKEIADRFGRSLVTMSEGMKKVEDFEGRDKSFAKTLSLIGEGENTELPKPDPTAFV